MSTDKEAHEKLRLAAYLGDAGARKRLGSAAPEVPPSDSVWLEALGGWGTAILVRALLAIARGMTEAGWSEAFPSTSGLTPLRDALQAWVDCPCSEHAAELPEPPGRAVPTTAPEAVLLLGGEPYRDALLACADLIRNPEETGVVSRVSKSQEALRSRASWSVFSRRALNCCVGRDVLTISQLLAVSRETGMMLWGWGQTVPRELEGVLGRAGLSWGSGEVPDEWGECAVQLGDLSVPNPCRELRPVRELVADAILR
jgi:hypothetical protein